MCGHFRIYFFGIFLLLVFVNVSCAAPTANIATAPTATNTSIIATETNSIPTSSATLGATATKTLHPLQTLLPTITPLTPITRSPTATRIPTLTPGPTFIRQPTITRTPTRTPPVTSFATIIPGATCPFNQSVVHVAPSSVDGFEWGESILPLNDPCVYGIQIDPSDENVWYVWGQFGLYITRDGGRTWDKPFNTFMPQVWFSPANAKNIYVSAQQTLYLTQNQGRTWNPIGNFPIQITSFAVGNDEALYVCPTWGSSPSPNGIYISRDRGATWQFFSYGIEQRGLLCWDIAVDPRDGTIYAGTEIYDHPKPYHPPLLRSRDGGKTWRDISGQTITWHVTHLAVNQQNGYVYAMTEGTGLYGSADQGEHWTLLSENLGASMLLDSNFPSRIFAGVINVKGQFTTLQGGLLVSIDKGNSFNYVGLTGTWVTGLTLNRDSTKLYVASYSSGIYVTKIPATAFPK